MINEKYQIINPRNLQKGDVVHVTTDTDLLMNRTILAVTPNAVQFDNNGQRFTVDNLYGASYALVKRPLPIQLGATYKQYIRVGHKLWVNRDEVGNATSVRLIHDEDLLKEI